MSIQNAPSFRHFPIGPLVSLDTLICPLVHWLHLHLCVHMYLCSASPLEHADIALVIWLKSRQKINVARPGATGKLSVSLELACMQQDLHLCVRWRVRKGTFLEA
jgi:hypothetical protein